jgi:hypothetical protein
MSENSWANDEKTQLINLLMEIRNIQREILIVQKEIALRLRISQEGKLEKIINNLFTSPEARKVYELSDGKSSREIAKIVGEITHVTVVNYWKEWARLGWVKPSDTYKGRWVQQYKTVTELVAKYLDDNPHLVIRQEENIEA